MIKEKSTISSQLSPLTSLTITLILLALHGPLKVKGFRKNVFPFGMIIVEVPGALHVSFHVLENA
jgi:hypothetical protein